MDAVENLFVPLCVYNNTKGDEDAQVLKAFQEPAWNNPVVRILDSRKKDLVDRIADDWTVRALARAMEVALEKTRRKVPAYLDLLAAEEVARSRGVETAVFGMG